MSFQVKFTKEFTKLFEKIQKKNPVQAEAIVKKIREIKDDPTHFKPLSNKLKGYSYCELFSNILVHNN